NVVHVGEIERHEIERALLLALCFFHRGGELIVAFARDGDRAIAVARELLHDAEAEPAAAAGDDDVTHSGAPACRWPRMSMTGRSARTRAPCAARADRCTTRRFHGAGPRRALLPNFRAAPRRRPRPSR